MTRPVSHVELDSERRERIVRAVLERSAPLLAIHAAPPGPTGMLAGWLRPALAAAAAVAIVAGGFLMAGGSAVRAQPAVSEALGYPAPIVGWLEAGRQPSVEELLVTMEVRKR